MIELLFAFQNNFWEAEQFAAENVLIMHFPLDKTFFFVVIYMVTDWFAGSICQL